MAFSVYIAHHLNPTTYLLSNKQTDNSCCFYSVLTPIEVKVSLALVKAAGLETLCLDMPSFSDKIILKAASSSCCSPPWLHFHL